MPSKGKVSSTEKLLQVIRKGDSALKAEDEAPAKEIPKGGSLLRVRRKNHLGVYLADNTVHWVCLQRHLGGRPRVEKVASTTGSFADIDQAVEVLRRGAKENVFPGGKNEIWAILDSNQAVLHNLVLPKMAEKEIPNAVYWSLKKDRAFSEGTVLDFEVQGEKVVKGIPKLAVLALTCPRSEIERWRDTFARAGLELTGLTVLPLCIQNLIASQQEEKRRSESSCAFLHIERKRTLIAIFNHGKLGLSREIRTGVDSMVEALQDYKGIQPGPEEEPVAADMDDSKVLNIEPPPQPGDQEWERLFMEVLDRLCRDTGEESAQDQERDEAFRPVLQRLAQQVERSFSYLTQYQGLPAVDRVRLSGYLVESDYFQSYLRDQLGVEVQPCAPALGYASAAAGPDYLSIPALGAALSSSARTMNLLFTHSQRKAFHKEARIHNALLVATAVLAVLIFGYAKWETGRLEADKEKLAGLEKRLAEFTPRVEESMLVQKISALKSQQGVLEDYAARFSDLAAFQEAVSLLPEEVQLSDIRLQKGEGKKGDGQGSLIIEGFVAGSEGDWETRLISYLVRLGDSRLLGDPVVYRRSTVEFEDRGRYLRFALRVSLAE
ncbi:MAG: hypothetical protein ACLFSY_10880 [Desulfonatronovibrionaceae bacterium]